MPLLCGWRMLAGISLLALQITEWHYHPLSPQETWPRDRGRKNWEWERLRLGHRESCGGKEQTISTIISIPLLLRNANTAAHTPKEPEVNREAAASSLTLGFSSSVLNQWQAEYTSKKRLSCGIKSQSEGVVGGKKTKREGRGRERMEQGR